ncbi:MAG: Ig-like domain-containing protein, partial [Acidobacteria bacterium]|nr:Ig-like domain-containing protein [Acidobacteriota bacterium]
MSYAVWNELEQILKSETETISTSQNGVAGYATFEGVPALQQFTVASDHSVHGLASASGQLAFEGDLQTIVLQLDRLASVRGTVYEIDGATPVAGASVRLSDGRQDVGTQLTATDGTFEFRNIAASTSVTAIANVTRDGIYRTGFASARTPSDGGAAENVSVVLRRRGIIEGKVVYAAYKVFDPLNSSNNVPDDTPEDLSDNAPVPLAKFWLRELGFPARALGSSVEPMTADAQGRFDLGNIFEGSLRATAWDSGNQEIRGDWSGQLVEEGERVQAIVAIGGGGVGALEVEVLDPNEANAPVVNAEVLLLRRSGLTWKAFDAAATDGAGRARFEQLPLGDYLVQAYSKALGRSGSSVVTPVLADETSEARVLLEFSGKVQGEVVDPMAGGTGVGGSHVTLRAFAYETRTTTEPTGAFHFDGVREGSFELSAREPDSNRWASATAALSQIDPEPFVRLELEPTESLHVQVDLPADDGTSSGVPAPSIAIDLTQAGITRSIQGENPATIPGLLLDHAYSIVARELGGEQRSAKFSGKFPDGDKNSPLRLVFPAFGGVRVTVVREGAPAPGTRVRASGGGRSVEAFTDAAGVALLSGLPVGTIPKGPATSVTATSLDGSFSDSATVIITSQSSPALVTLQLGTYAGVSGYVEAETGGASVGTVVTAAFTGKTLQALTDGEGRFRIQGIPTSASGTHVLLTYFGPDGATVGARQTAEVPADAGSSVIEVEPVRLDATPPRILSLTPADGATEVSPDSSIVVVFSEPIRTDQLHNGMLTLIPADS